MKKYRIRFQEIIDYEVVLELEQEVDAQLESDGWLRLIIEHCPGWLSNGSVISQELLDWDELKENDII